MNFKVYVNMTKWRNEIKNVSIISIHVCKT